jgi:hypothetical protein
MIAALARTLDDYPGDPNRARCFNHIIALVGKRMIRQFDVPKGGADAALDEAEKELRNLAEGIDIEDMLAKGRQETDEEDDEDDDGDDGDEMDVEDHADLEASTRPIRLVLVKVNAPELLGVADLI